MKDASAASHFPHVVDELTIALEGRDVKRSSDTGGVMAIEFALNRARQQWSRVQSPSMAAQIAGAVGTSHGLTSDEAKRLADALTDALSECKEDKAAGENWLKGMRVYAVTVAAGATNEKAQANPSDGATSQGIPAEVGEAAAREEIERCGFLYFGVNEDDQTENMNHCVTASAEDPDRGIYLEGRSQHGPERARGHLLTFIRGYVAGTGANKAGTTRGLSPSTGDMLPAYSDCLAELAMALTQAEEDAEWAREMQESAPGKDQYRAARFALRMLRRHLLGEDEDRAHT